MANYTCTSDMSLEQCITNGSMVNGENLTINSGAKVTCDRTPSILIGIVNINQGELFIDGTNISSGNMINFVGEYGQTINAYGQGLFNVDGMWYNIGTTDGTNAQVFNLSTYYDSSFCVDVLPMIQIETGRRINYSTFSANSPSIDDWIYKSSNRSVMGRIVSTGVNYVVVKFLTGSLVNGDSIEIRKIVDDNGPDLQKAWSGTVNHASGDIREPGVYQEFGNSVVNGISHIGAFHHGIGGFVFSNIFQSTTLTMGTASGTTGGFVPPSGCNVRVPNVHFSTSNITNYTSNNTYHDGGTQEYNRYNLGTSNGGKVNLNLCNVGSSFFGCSAANEFKCYNVGATISIGSTIAGTKTIYHNSCVCADPLDLAGNNQPFHLTDLANGTEVKDCYSVSAACIYSFDISSSVDINISGCIVSDAGQGTNIAIRGPKYRFIRSKNIIFNNNAAIGNNSSSTYPIIFVQTCENFSLNHFIFSSTQSETTQTNNIPGFVVSEMSKDIEFIGMEMIGLGVPGRWFFQIDDVTDLRVRCIGLIDDQIDFGAYADEFIYIGGSCEKIDVARCWKKNGGIKNFSNAASNSKNIRIVNSSADYASLFRPSAVDNVLWKGVHAGSGNPGGTTGIEDTIAANYGYQFTDGFRSDTIGYIVCNNKAPSTDINYVTIIAGNPLFYNNGYLNMVSGDIIEIEMSYFARGHISFSGTYTSSVAQSVWNANEWTNITVDFQYDVGSGWNGTWLNARTATNWTGISIIAATGVKLKYRYTATGIQNYMSMFIIDTVTSIAIQKSNYYTIDQNLVEVKVIVKKVSDMSLLQNAMVLLEADSGGDLAIGTDILKGLTDSNGEIKDEEFLFTNDQPVIGKARMATSPPFYKTSNISGTITEDGLLLTAYMILDQ